MLIMWWITFVAWCGVFVLWVRSILKYNKIYRKYEQACREYKESDCQPSKKLSLAQQSLGEFNQRHSMMLNSLRRCGLILGNTNIQSGSGEVKLHARIDGVSRDGNKILNLWNRRLVQPSTKIVSFLGGYKNFLGCLSHKDDTRMTPNVSKLSHSRPTDGVDKEKNL